MSALFALQVVKPKQKILILPAALHKDVLCTAFQFLRIFPNCFSAQALGNIILLLIGQIVALTLQSCQNAIFDRLLADLPRTEQILQQFSH